MSDAAQMIQDAVDRLLSCSYDGARRRQYQSSDCGFSLDNWRALAELGVLGLPFSEADGGVGGGLRELVSVAESFGKCLAVEPYLSDVVLTGRLFARVADRGMRREWIPQISAGSKRIVAAVNEDAFDFDSQRINTTARAVGDEWVLRGTKCMVMFPSGADYYLASARVSGQDAFGGEISLFMIPAGAKGVRTTLYTLVDGSIAGDLLFDSVGEGIVRLGGTNNELDLTVTEARIAAIGEMVGIMSLMFQATLDYVKVRRQFAKPLSSFQVIQHRLVDLYVVLEQARSLLEWALISRVSADNAPLIAGIKSQVGRFALELGRECIQLHGGIGITDELIIGHGYKRLLTLASVLGGQDAELDRYAKSTFSGCNEA